MLHARENLMEAIQAFLKKYDQIHPKEKSMALLLAEERFLKIKQAVEEEKNQPENIQELLLKLINDSQILNGIQLKQEEQAAKISSQYWKPPIFYDDDDDDDEESFIPLRDIISELPVSIDPLYNETDSIPQGNDNGHFNAESDLIESLLNRETLMVSSSKINSLLEVFSHQVNSLIIICFHRIDEADFDPEEDIRLVDKWLYDNSSPRPPEELKSEISDAIIESFSPSHIPVEDSDSLMERSIYFSFSGSTRYHPVIENDDCDSERDVLKELLNNDSISLPEYESFHVDFYNVSSSPRPPEKPLVDLCFNFDIEPDTRSFLTTKLTTAVRLASSILVFRVLCFMSRIALDFKDSRAHGFVHRSLDLQSLA
ncbi:hypothetical protein Tco_0091916 [Tanacetum coccineum]